MGLIIFAKLHYGSCVEVLYVTLRLSMMASTAFIGLAQLATAAMLIAYTLIKVSSAQPTTTMMSEVMEGLSAASPGGKI